MYSLLQIINPSFDINTKFKGSHIVNIERDTKLLPQEPCKGEETNSWQSGKESVAGALMRPKCVFILWCTGCTQALLRFKRQLLTSID
jgi:hypothetical protein